MLSPSQVKGLIFDLEVVPGNDVKPDVITMVGALRPDTREELEIKINSNLLPTLEKLDSLSKDADFVLGHNIIEHDLPLLRKNAPRMTLHHLPVIDTLWLSPLAFPQNPYHRLVKDYKLIRDSLNSPLSDCRSTLTLFQDQKLAFAHLGKQTPTELLCYQALLAPSQNSDLGPFFKALTGRDFVTIEEARQRLPDLLRENDATLERDFKVCKTRLDKLLSEDIENSDFHWPLAYALAWLRVSGGNSVIPPWVRHQFSIVGSIIKELRDVPCGKSNCRYCVTTHDPRHELRRYFPAIDDFRVESSGRHLQYEIVLAGMRGLNVLAVLATGGGKSLCYQIPALNRFHRNGSLTVIISPLQSLMKDQVDGMLQRNIQCAATLNGLLSMPERADVLEKIQMGDVGILLVSPEQFRNNAFRQAIKQRQVGAWIFDEAHCLSKWGNDFRPDYLYVSRFIKENSNHQPPAPIGCFTATAKQEVLEDIRIHFKENLGIYFELFLGTHERKNLNFEVLPCFKAEKPARTDELLKLHISERRGGAVVFVASRKHAEELAEFLSQQKWLCRHFHAGLQPNEKKDIQDDFIKGELDVIVATNAFGMGVDKPNIRLVVHADIPGSLENYLQEAGRAGRDQGNARCVLLYDPHDIETQFGLTERSKLSLNDIQQILRKLRTENARRKGAEIVITAGEILMDEHVHTNFAAEDQDAETKVATAIAWLERGNYLSREQNQTRIFPAKLNIAENEIEERLKQANLPVRRMQEYRSILRFIAKSRPDKPINTDQLMALTSRSHEEITSALKQMEELGLLSNDSQLTLYLRHGVTGASAQRLRQSIELEINLFNILQEQAPDAESGAWQDLNLNLLTSTLKDVMNLEELLPFYVQRLLRTLATGRDGENQQRGVFDLKQVSSDNFRVRINHKLSWKQVELVGEKRRTISDKLLGFLIAKITPGFRSKDILVETSFGELINVIDTDLDLRQSIAPHLRHKAVQHVLLYMHRQDVITLNQGLTVMRRAMTIKVNHEKRNNYSKEDYKRLNEHYVEKRIQVHVMREYAELGLKAMATALELVLDYFSMQKVGFLARHFSGREGILERPTSEESWKSITGVLSRPQQQIVIDNDDCNRLILAGPGSGKTRVIVHRIAYLLRIRRVSASSIVALTFNRHAANEINKRLYELVGEESFGIRVLTYHSMAMRLTGARFKRGDKVDETVLKKVVQNAVEHLEGTRQTEGEDNLRDQLLRGYRFILVDEYQDIDDMQYRLVSALAGRHASEDERLCIIAVGDDDQNIYTWRETSSSYIDQFKHDYNAKINFLIENYRSTKHIINAANAVIEGNPARLKIDNPIQINRQRNNEPAGANWEKTDPIRMGRVARLLINNSDRQCGNIQIQAAFQELKRIILIENGDWTGCAILARSHRFLCTAQAWCELHKVPYFLAADKNSGVSLNRQRGFVSIIEALRDEDSPLSADDGVYFLHKLTSDSSWRAFFETALFQMKAETGNCHLSRKAFIEWLYDYAREIKEQPRTGIYLGTVHSAKGLEFRHVALLDGDWDDRLDNICNERRLYYVGMTRAQQTLTLCEFESGNPFSHNLNSEVLLQKFNGQHDPALDERFHQLSLDEIDLSYAARKDPADPVYGAVANLTIGSALHCRQNGDRYEFIDQKGCVVSRTTKKFKPDFNIENCEVAYILVRYIDDVGEFYRHQHKVDQWEVVVPRVRGTNARSR